MSVDQELKCERDYLLGARAELARMRKQTLSLKADAGDRVSSQFLAATLYRRAQSLIDDPSANLFFGRIDQQRSDATTPERWYIGRRHVADSHGDPVVIDWRADVSRAFYRASEAEPMGVSLRRRFGIDRGQLTAYEDERLDGANRSTEPIGSTFRSQILVGEIERPRVGPMRDIVATIQPEQDAIVRCDVGTTVCVQGAPGTGKTAVGLHRAAWLLYAFRERLARSGVLVVGPNRAFLDHIGAVLPTLGEVEVRHCTIDELFASVRVRCQDSVQTAVLKGDPRLADVLHAAVWSFVRTPTEALVLPRGAHKWTVQASQAAEIVQELRTRGVRYDAARRMLPHRLAHAILLQMEQAGDSPDDRVQEAVARSGAVKRYAARVWPALDPKAVLFSLLSNATTMHRHAADLLTDAECSMLLWSNPVANRGSARWSAADAVLVDEINDQLARTPSLGHVVLDEAQDLSPMQLRAVGRRCSTGSATVLGDLAQGTTPWATDSWQASLEHLGKPDAVIEVLERGFRVPASVIEYAAQLLPSMAPDLGLPVSVRDNPGRLEIVWVEGAGLYERVAGSVAKTLAEPGSIGVIVPDSAVQDISKALSRNGVDHGVLGANHGDVDHQVDVVPATVAKGLEFDRVIVVEPSAIAAAEPDRRTGLRRLYVVLTRAVCELTVFHSDELPFELKA
jgi:DNA helicase IV